MQVPNDSFETINDNFKINMQCHSFCRWWQWGCELPLQPVNFFDGHFVQPRPIRHTLRLPNVLMKRDSPTASSPLNIIVPVEHCHVVSKVPIRQSSINDLGERYYKEPNPYHGTLKVCVPPDWMQHSCSKSRAKPISPPENTLAFLL